MGRDHDLEEWLPGGMGPRTPASATVERPETVDLNAIGFEGLIGLGISVGQAARFVSQRERRGGISALHEIDGFYGLAPGVREILRWSGHV